MIDLGTGLDDDSASTAADAPDGTPAIPLTWVRALVPTAVLSCLRHGPLHGYAIAKALSELGFGTLKGGSLYPALSRLEEAGAVSTAWAPGPSGPARREYTLTAKGRQRLHEELEAMHLLHRRLGDGVETPADTDEHARAEGEPHEA